MSAPAYYGSRIGPNMTRTPEGYLICHNVPIARTGEQEYLGEEIGLPERAGEKVTVYRDPAEVFKPQAMSSFEGKPVVDGHPMDDVRPDNYASIAKGHVQNVRRGIGPESDLLLADLFVTDPTLISEIDAGKREVSCGYGCDYELTPDGRYRQVHIEGNHVAIVPKGRAGDRVAIKDEAPKETVPQQTGPGKPQRTKERRPGMKPDRTNIWGRMLSAFAKDAEPEEVAEAAKMAPREEEEAADGLAAPAVMPPKQVAPMGDAEGENADRALMAELIAAIKALTARVEAIEDGEEGEEKPEGLDALIGELEKKPTPAANGEESVTVEPEQIHDELAEIPAMTPEERGENPLTGDSMLPYLKKVSSVVATIKDANERRRVSDALAKEFRNARPASIPTEDGYAAIVGARGILRQTQDAAKNDPREEGRAWMKKYNPTYKNREVN